MFDLLPLAFTLKYYTFILGTMRDICGLEDPVFIRRKQNQRSVSACTFRTSREWWRRCPTCFASLSLPTMRYLVPWVQSHATPWPCWRASKSLQRKASTLARPPCSPSPPWGFPDLQEWCPRLSTSQQTPAPVSEPAPTADSQEKLWILIALVNNHNYWV